MKTRVGTIAVHTLCYIVAFICIGIAQQDTTHYFPKSARQDLKFLDLYAKDFPSLQDPSLWKMAAKKEVEAYRFLWTGGYLQEHYCVRLSVKPDKTAIVTFKMIEDRYANDKWVIVYRKEKPITEKQFVRIRKQLEISNFWNMKSQDKYGMDGDVFLIEGVKQGNYHVTELRELKPLTIRRAITTLVGMAGIKLERPDELRRQLLIRSESCKG